MKQGAFLKSHELTWNMRDRVWELTGKVEDPNGKEIQFYFPLSNLSREMYIRLIEENHQFKKLLKECKEFFYENLIDTEFHFSCGLGSDIKKQSCIKSLSKLKTKIDEVLK